MPQERTYSTPRFYDPRTQEYKDAEIPTVTRTFSWPQRRGVRVRAARGTISATGGYLEGSHRLTGSHYDLAPGSYSMRVFRLSIGVAAGGHGVVTDENVGSDGNFRGGTSYLWHIRHSRDGTKDIINFPRPGHLHQVARPYEPIYSFGPGTVIWGWLGDHAGNPGTRAWFLQSFEAVIDHSLT